MQKTNRQVKEKKRKNLPKAVIDIQVGDNALARGLEHHGATLDAIEALNGEAAAVLKHAAGGSTEASKVGSSSEDGDGELHLDCSRRGDWLMEV